MPKLSDLEFLYLVSVQIGVLGRTLKLRKRLARTEKMGPFPNRLDDGMRQ